MRFTHLRLQNWRNFLSVDAALQKRVFLAGPNAAGKSNLLDAIRFLRDIADPQGGGLQAAVKQRGSVSQIRSLHAGHYPVVVVDVKLDLDGDGLWRYSLEFNMDKQRQPSIKKERVEGPDGFVMERPDEDDKQDTKRLSQTHLEQVNSNKGFRSIATFLSQVRYVHLVPQLVREPERSVGRARDPFGGDFLEQLAVLERKQKKTFDSRLRRIKDALRVAVPQLDDLKLERDVRGVPHLKGLYKHWRHNAGWQQEDQFSDGTLRLLGLLWALLDGTAPLLLEEPELSLHSAVVRHVAPMMARLSRKSGRQIFISTHSPDLLSDQGIAPEEVLLLVPSSKGTEVRLAADDEQVRSLLEEGLSMADAVLPRTAPASATQLLLFGD